MAKIPQTVKNRDVIIDKINGAKEKRVKKAGKDKYKKADIDKMKVDFDWDEEISDVTVADENGNPVVEKDIKVLMFRSGPPNQRVFFGVREDEVDNV